MKIIKITKCNLCPHFQQDPNTQTHKFWGKTVCVYNWTGTRIEDEKKIKIIDHQEHNGISVDGIPLIDIPQWCPLEDFEDAIKKIIKKMVKKL